MPLLPSYECRPPMAFVMLQEDCKPRLVIRGQREKELKSAKDWKKKKSINLVLFL